jgi:hypothetical protein
MGRKLIYDYGSARIEHSIPTITAQYFYPNKYAPHQGKKEKARRVERNTLVNDRRT